MNLQRRVEELEDLVRQICGTVDVNFDSATIADFRTSPRILQTYQNRPSNAASSFPGVEGSTSTAYTPSMSENASSFLDDSDHIEDFEDTPLINLFKDAMILDSDDSRTRNRLLDLPANAKLRNSIRLLASLIPNPPDLGFILDTTAKYWSFWPPCYLSPHSAYLVHDERVNCPLSILSNALMSGKPALIGKGVIFLALCIQQLPKEVHHQRLHITASPKLLIQSYLEITQDLLAVSEDMGPSIDDLECLMLQMKLYINLGKPRKAWLRTRQAFSTALLLGLHRPDDGQDSRKERVWGLIWQSDRQLSVLLGFPSATTNSHPSISAEFQESGHHAVFHRMCIVAGSVIERDQTHHTADYSITVKIQGELEELRSTISNEWWDPRPDFDLSAEDLYHRYSTKIQFFHLCNLVHLPYMLKSSTSSKYSHSRVAALEASRDLIRQYQGFRRSAHAAHVICELMDFVAFFAASVITIDLFSQTHRRPDAEEAEDWSMVESLTGTLRHVSKMMECNVAAQGAQLLQFLAAANRGDYQGPEKYEVVVPYFGRVRINRAAGIRSREQLTSARAEESFIPSQSQFGNTVEFSSNSFGRGMLMDTNVDEELGCDWSMMAEFDTTYDWFQTFA